ncbi:lipopolysaccharide assembly protein LapA domain-containing protein [Roseovarius aestuariivivens]|uniref:lipopolysaccharide assembly protein LapA domain-containing protein n=1 Tax=Roseovarius aestuariivivens TaxID=1888910 RepID=UPI00108003C5|nr:LapA family protein [Roseovarius aestuariivivens]
MRYIRYACIAIFGLALVLIALANRQTVEVDVLPPELAGFFALTPSYTVPLFVIMFGGVLAGLIIGFIWEWIREAKERAEAARQAREMARLRAEITRLKGEKHKDKDEVLVMLEEAS